MKPVECCCVQHLVAMLIVDETVQEEGCDKTRNEGHENRTDGTKIGGEKGQDRERRKSYSAAVIDWNQYVGESIVRKTDSTLNKDKDIVVCLPGARIEHVTERIQRIMGRGHGGTLTGSHRDEQRSHGGNKRDIEEIQGSTEGDEGSKGWTDYLIRDFTSVWNQEPRIQKYEEDGSQRDGRLQLCREEEVGFVDLWDSFVGKKKRT